VIRVPSRENEPRNPKDQEVVCGAYRRDAFGTHAVIMKPLRIE
jgi:hypothetical protein